LSDWKAKNSLIEQKSNQILQNSIDKFNYTLNSLPTTDGITHSVNKTMTFGLGKQNILYYIDWSVAYSTSNVSNILVLTSFTCIYWGLFRLSVNKFQIPFSESLLSEIKRISDEAVLHKQNFIQEAMSKNFFKDDSQIIMFGEVFRCRSLRFFFNENILSESRLINWNRPFDVDKQDISKHIKLLFEESSYWASEFVDIHNIPDRLFMDFCKLHYNYNLIEASNLILNIMQPIIFSYFFFLCTI